MAVLPESLVTVLIPAAWLWQRALDSVDHTYVTSISDIQRLSEYANKVFVTGRLFVPVAQVNVSGRRYPVRILARSAVILADGYILPWK
jgi:hypothetical protein